MTQQAMPQNSPTASEFQQREWATEALRQQRQRMLAQIVIYLFLIMGAVAMLIPLLWLVSSSFKDSGRIFIFPPAVDS